MSSASIVKLKDSSTLSGMPNAPVAYSAAVTVQLTQEDINLLVEALDAYEYWEAGDPLPRNNGSVFIPGDLRPEDDRYWGAEPSPNETELEAIERVQACRDLGDRLAAIRDVATDR